MSAIHAHVFCCTPAHWLKGSKLSEITPCCKEGKVYFTSEANAFGLGWQRFYDGKVVGVPLRGLCRHVVVIKEVEEFHYDPWGCTKQSYYECLGHRFAKENLDTQDIWCDTETDQCVYNVQVEGFQRCTFDRKCSSLTLPKQVGIPTCGSFLGR